METYKKWIRDMYNREIEVAKADLDNCMIWQDVQTAALIEGYIKLLEEEVSKI